MSPFKQDTVVRKHPARCSSSKDWLGGLLITARTARDATDSIGVPYVKALFATVVAILEVIETVRKNEDDLRDLCLNVVAVVEILQEELTLHGDSTATHFKMCIDFQRYLVDIFRAVEKMQDGKSGFRGKICRFLKSASIADDIQTFQARLNDSRANLTLAAAVDTNFSLARVHDAFITELRRTVGTSTLDIRQEVRTLRSQLIRPERQLLSKFRTIPAGDLNLLHEVSQDRGYSSLIWKDADMKGGVDVIRTIYTAHVPGEQSTMTVIRYQGDDAQQVWEEDLKRYADVRHPNILQLYGVAPHLPATVFYDELLCVDHFENLQSESSILLAYTKWTMQDDYFKTVRYWVGEHEDEMPSATVWVRKSTGQVCLTLSNEPGSVLASDWGRVYLFGLPRVPKVTMDISDSRQETRVVSQLSLADFHHVCRCEGHHCSFRLPPGEYVVLGSIVQQPQTPDAPVVALMDCGFLGRVRSQGWNADRGDDFPRKAGVIMENGWTRFSLADLTADGRVKSPRCRCDLYLEDDSAKANAHAWLAQANHVLSVLGVTQNLGSYALVDEIICYIYLEWEDKIPIRDAYLFACPVQLCSKMGLRLAPEAHLMYWALDPGGTERLPPNAAAALGLPTLEFYAKVMGVGWQAYHYDALMHFHRAKGFDPCSQEVARHMEYPLLLAAPSVCTVADDQGDDMTLVDFEGSTNAAREATAYESMGKGGQLVVVRSRQRSESISSVAVLFLLGTLIIVVYVRSL